MKIALLRRRAVPSFPAAVAAGIRIRNDITFAIGPLRYIANPEKNLGQNSNAKLFRHCCCRGFGVKSGGELIERARKFVGIEIGNGLDEREKIFEFGVSL